MPNAKPAIAPRARPARRSFARAGRLTIAAGPGAGTTTSPAWWKRRLSTPPGWNACRTAFRTARPRRPYERSAIWTSPNFRRSFRRAASAGIDHPSLTLTHVMHRDLPRPSLRATPKALRYGRGSLLCMTWISSRPPPMRGHDWTRKGGRNWKRFDTDVDAFVAIWCVCFCGMQWRVIGLLCDILFGTLYGLFARWTRLGLWRRLLDRLRRSWRRACGDAPEPSAVVIDSRSCRSAPSCFDRGIDGGKKIRGVKINVAVDKYGIPLAIDVSPANRHDTKGIVPVL